MAFTLSPLPYDENALERAISARTVTSKNGKLAVEKTSNALDPMARGVNCLLTIDVWEHAHYLDYQNERAKYLQAVLLKLLNWNFAAKNLEKEGLC